MSYNVTQLPKSLRKELLADYTATVTYCRHTGVKLVIGTEFQNTNLRGKFLKQEHPIFALTKAKLLDLIGTNFHKCNTTEKYLLIAAFLKLLKPSAITERSSVLDTTSYPLALSSDTVTKLASSFYYLVKAYKNFITSGSHYPALPSYKVTAELANDTSAILAFVKRLTILLEQASFLHLPSSRELSVGEKLDDELALEQQLKTILNNYDAASKPKHYTRTLGKWAIKQLVIVAPDLADDTIASISYYIQCDSNKLDDVVLKEYINLLESVLPMGDLEREQSLLVIAHLKSKLDVIYRALEDYSFIILEEEDNVIGSRQATEDTEAIAGVRVTNKKINSNRGDVDNSPVPISNRQTFGASDALSRLMAKFGGTKQPTVIRQGKESKV